MQTGTITDNRRILKKLFRDAFFVICLMELIHSAASMTDSWFIGHYMGSDGMAAMGLAKPFYSFVDIICGPFGLGTQLVCSHYIGKCEMDRAQKAFSGSLLIGLIISALLTVIGLAGPSVIASLQSAGKVEDDILKLSEGYLRGLFLGTPAMICFGVLSPIAQLGGGKKIITSGIIAQLIADVAGDALSVLVFDGGMFGLGLATALSYYAALIPLLIHFCSDSAILRLQLMNMPYADLKEIIRSGSSKSIKRICNTVKPMILNMLSIALGTAMAVSAYSITNQVRDLLISFSAGISGATILIGALLYGQRDREGLHCLSRISMQAIGMIVAVGALCIAFAEPIARFFVSDSEDVIEMAAMSVICVGIMIPFATFNGVIISFMQITKRHGYVKVLSFLNRLILIVITSAVMGLLFGTDGLWWALPASEILNAVISLLLIRHLNGRMPRKASDLLCLADDFGYMPEDYIEISVRNPDDMAELQEKVGTFCTEHGIDSRRSFFTQLALEELTMNVIRHGFPECRHKPQLHIWITYDDGDMYLHIQDNCPGFNVMKHCAEMQQESSEHCVGLRLVKGIAKEMKYVNSLDTNNVIITI